MPESVRDRPTKSHEYLFLLTKSERYYFDGDAVKEQSTDPEYRLRGKVRPSVDSLLAAGGGWGPTGAACISKPGEGLPATSAPSGRSRRGRTRAYHFATFPPKLVIPCIKAGTSERGCCPECGGSRGSVWSNERRWSFVARNVRIRWGTRDQAERCSKRQERRRRSAGSQPATTIAPRCPCVVLKRPFAGSGTTGFVCVELGRDFIGIDLNPKYLTLARKRIKKAQLELVH